MKHSLKQGFFPWFSLLAGLVGFALQSTLMSTMDENGLLPRGHFADTLSFVLLAVVIGVLFLVLPKEKIPAHYGKMFPPSYLAAGGILLSGLGLAISSFSLNAGGILQLLVLISGVLSGGALAVTAYCRIKGLRPNCLLHCVVVVFFILRIISCCQAWGAEPQLQLYFFHLLACLFLLLACYYRAELDVKNTGYRPYLFFGQAALFLCCLCLTGEDRLFYLSAGLWMATDFCVLPHWAKND